MSPCPHPATITITPRAPPNNNNNNNKKKKKKKKKKKNLDLVIELKNLWNMKVTIVSIVIGAFGTVTKGLLKGRENLEVG